MTEAKKTRGVKAATEYLQDKKTEMIRPISAKALTIQLAF